MSKAYATAKTVSDEYLVWTYTGMENPEAARDLGDAVRR